MIKNYINNNDIINMQIIFILINYISWILYRICYSYSIKLKQRVSANIIEFFSIDNSTI